MSFRAFLVAFRAFKKNNQIIETSYSLLFSVCRSILTDIDLVDTASIWKEIFLFEKI